MKIKCWSCATLVDLSNTTCYNCGKRYVTKQQCGATAQDIIILHVDTTMDEVNHIRTFVQSVASLGG